MKRQRLFKVLTFIAMLVILIAGCDKDDDTINDDQLEGANEGHQVDKYVHGEYKGHTWRFDDIPYDIACTNDGKKVWVITNYAKYGPYWKEGGELKQGNENGNFSTIHTFGDTPQSVVLSADGSLGYVVTDGNNIDKYENGNYVGHIDSFDGQHIGVACTADGTKVWVVTDDQKLHTLGYHSGL